MLTNLAIRNIRGIEALDVDIAGPLVIMGRNGSGKTSTLDALRYICTSSMKDRTGKSTLKAHLLRVAQLIYITRLRSGKTLKQFARTAYLCWMRGRLAMKGLHNG